MSVRRAAIPAFLFLLASAAPGVTAAVADAPPATAAPAASASASTDAAATAAAAPAWIRSEDIASRADRLERRIDTTAPDARTVAAVERAEAGTTVLGPQLDRHIADAKVLLERSTSLVELGDASRELESAAAPLEDWKQALSQEARATAAFLDELASEKAAWTATRARPETKAAGDVVVARVDDALADIARAEVQRRQWLSRVLTVTDRIVDRSTAVAAMRSELAAAADNVGRHMLQPDHEPLWALPWRAGLAGELARVPGEAASFAADSRDYFQRDGRPLLVHVLVALLATFGLSRLSSRARTRLAGVAGAERARRIFETPVAAGLMIAVLATPLIHPLAPRRFVQIIAILAVVPAARILVHAGAPVTPGMFAALFGVVLVDRLTMVFAALPLLWRVTWLASLAGLLAMTSWWSRRFRGTEGVPDAMPRLARIASWSLGLSILAGAAGWCVLSAILGRTVAVGITAGLYVYPAVLALDAVVAFALASPPFDRSRVVRGDAASLQHAASVVTRWIGVALWLKVTLTAVGLWEGAAAVGSAAWQAGVSVGDATLSVGGIVSFVLTLVALPFVVKTVDVVLQGDVFPRANLPRGLPLVLSTLVRYGLWLSGFLLALAMAGLHVSDISIVIGGLGIGVGMGLQDAVRNFAAGIAVLLERRIHVGDALQIPKNDIFGRVLSIGMRATVVRNWDGAEVVVPNSDLVSAPVTNWTLSDRSQRIEVAVSVKSGVDPRRVLEVLHDVALRQPSLIQDPAPQALLVKLGEDSNSYLLRGWIDEEFEGASVVRSNLALSVHDAIHRAGLHLAKADGGDPSPPMDTGP